MARTIVRSDTQIHKAVLQELKWDPRVDEAEVGVEVDNGVVTLTGNVNSYAKKLAAEEAAHHAQGVLDVANDVDVHVANALHQTDTEVAQAVRSALESDVFVLADRIETTVSAGWVTLRGTVDFWSQRVDPERAIFRLSGVVGVTNAIQVRAPDAAAETLRGTTEETSGRYAERQVWAHRG